MNQKEIRKYRFGILGCGMIAGVHAAAIRSLEEAELVGAADIGKETAKYGTSRWGSVAAIAEQHGSEKARQFCEKWGIHAYENEEDMLSDDSIDIVCICTPSHCHAENAINALRHGKHVVLEKPMALNCEEADRIIAACEESHRLLTVVSQLRFSPDIQHVRQLVQKNAFGQVVFCNLSMYYWRSAEYFAGSPWRGRMKYEGGGALMNQGIHGIDLMLHIMGEAKVLKGETRTLYHAVGVEDAGSALVSFDQGSVTGVIQGSTCTWPGFARRMEIHGTKGFVVLKENMIEQLQTEEDQIDRRKDAAMDLGSHNRPDMIDSHMHALQFQNLIDAIEGRAQLLIDAREGRKAIRLIEDLYDSSAIR